MLDGADLNQKRNYGYSTELNAPFLLDIDRIEFVQGPGSTVHGSGAINGFMNIIPKNGANYPGLDVRLEGGYPDEEGKIEIGYGKKYSETTNLYIYGGYVQSAGFEPKDYPWNDRGMPHQYQTPTYLSNLTLAKWSGANPRFQEFNPTYKVGAYYNHGNLSINYFFENIWESADFFACCWFSNVAPGIGDLWTNDLGWFHGEMAIQPKYTVPISATDNLVLSVNAKMDDDGFFNWGKEPLSSMAKTMLLGEGWPGATYGYHKNNVSMSGETLIKAEAVYKTTRFDKNSLAVGINSARETLISTLMISLTQTLML